MTFDVTIPSFTQIWFCHFNMIPVRQTGGQTELLYQYCVLQSSAMLMQSNKGEHLKSGG